SNQILQVTSTSATTQTFVLDGELNRIWNFESAREELIKLGAVESVVSNRWIANHYRWIVWKIAAMARANPDWHIQNNRWSPESIVEQLLYRYQVEYCEGKRTCLKKIAEGDMASEGLMVLCVADIFIDGTSVCESGYKPSSSRNILLELTDGWYSLKAQIDEVLCRAVQRNKISVGQKLFIFGAQNVGEKIPGSPLEVGDRFLLKIFANSTKIASWDAKLGNQKQANPFQVSIESVKADGGSISLVDVIIERVFPVIYFENNVKRTEVEEDEEMRKYDDECEKIMAEMKYSSEYDDTVDIRQLAFDNIGQRKVSRMLKIRVCDFPPEDCTDEKESASRILTIWNADPGSFKELKEGKRVKFIGLLPDSWHGECNLKMGTKRQFFSVPVTPEQLQRTKYRPRKNFEIQDLESINSGDEFDVMGVVLAADKNRITLTDTSLALLHLTVCQKANLKVGEIVCFKNVQFHHRDGNSNFFGQIGKDIGIIGGTSNTLAEREIRINLTQF
ncbi:Breast cancer 2, early onset, partial [Physocladia obscura]